MSTYAIGDIQGCYVEFCKLLDLLNFDTASDRLLLVGDLVNRGPNSLEVLRFVKNLGENAECVLGNHDLHLLAVAHGVKSVRPSDTLDGVLTAPDRSELLTWLRHRPLIYLHAAPRTVIVHAGLPPQWDTTAALLFAEEVERRLRADSFDEVFRSMYGDKPGRWAADLRPRPRLRFIINCLTRIRYCDASGLMAMKEKGPPGTQAEGHLPWYAVPNRASATDPIVFGHWSTLRLNAQQTRDYNVHHLDRGCVWGGELVALRLEDHHYFTVPAERPYA